MPSLDIRATDTMKPMSPMEPMKPMQPMAMAAASHEHWWPGDLGEPSSAGSENERRYAYFATQHRLAVDDGKRVRVFDTAGKPIDGFAQSQGHGHALRFSSDGGSVGLDALKEI